MNIELQIIEVIKNKYNIFLEEIKLSKPPKKEMGDYAFNCGILARDLKKSPVIIASEIIDDIKSINIVEDVTQDNAYLNIKMSNKIFTDIFKTIKNRSFDKKDTTIVIDYIGANVGKPLHIGHMCTPNVGQVMINVYKKLGYDVISDSHIGDWGIIFGKLITAYKKWGDKSKLENNAVDYLLELYVKITAESEKDESLEQSCRDEFKLLSEGNEESKKLWAEFTSYSIKAMNILLARMNIYPEYNVGESFYEGLGLAKMEDYPDLQDDMGMIVKELISSSIATKNEDNSVGVEFEDQTKLPSCILQKRDGTHGYLASDLACIKYRMQNWSPDKIIYFVDVRQNLHFRQAFKIAESAGWLDKNNKKTELIHAYNGFVSGKEGAFSSRKGNIIKLGDLLDEAELRAEKIILEKRDDIGGEELKSLSKMIGIGAIKYGYLKKSRDSDVVFDWDEFMTFEGNSAPYIQYTYVRGAKILEKYGKDISSEIVSDFEDQNEIELIKALSEYNQILEKTASTNMPHHLCNYLYNLTKIFNSFYNNLHILNEENENKKQMRLQLLQEFLITLKDGFSLLGIDMPERM